MLYFSTDLNDKIMKYRVEGKVTISTWTMIEAESPEEAIKKAEERQEKMSIASNNGDSGDYEWMIEDMDGEPFDLEAED
jgi:hypothetical protein